MRKKNLAMFIPHRSRPRLSDPSPEPERRKKLTLFIVFCRIRSQLPANFPVNPGRPRPVQDHRREALTSLSKPMPCPSTVKESRGRKIPRKLLCRRGRQKEAAMTPQIWTRRPASLGNPQSFRHVHEIFFSLPATRSDQALLPSASLFPGKGT